MPAMIRTSKHYRDLIEKILNLNDRRKDDKSYFKKVKSSKKDKDDKKSEKDD